MGSANGQHAASPSGEPMPLPAGDASVEDMLAEEVLWPDVVHQACGKISVAQQTTPAQARALLRSHAQHVDGTLDVEALTELAMRVVDGSVALPLSPPGPRTDDHGR